MSMLEVAKLGVAIGGVTALEGISLSLGKGQRLGVVGRSGSGKSLLALAIAGLLPADATLTGSVRFDEATMPSDDASMAKLRGGHVGIITQGAESGLDPLWTIDQHILEVMGRATAAGVPAEARAVFDDLGLDAGQTGRYPRSLSVDERRRVVVGLALLNKPDLLIADNPTASLDPIGQRQVLDLIGRHCKEHQMALLLIADDLKVVAQLCNQVMVLDRGRVAEAGDKAEVLGHPRHNVTRTIMTAGRRRTRTLARAPIGGPLVDVRHVTRRFRQPDVSIFEPRPPKLALDDVSLALREGEALAVIGPAGSGKSTLARIVAGLERTSSGELEIDHVTYHGIDLPRPLRRQIGFVFHDPRRSFSPLATVGESVAEPLRLEAQESMDDLGARLVELVEAVGLSPTLLEHFPRDLPQADLQRMAIARALMARPKLVVLDDPVSALDIVERGEVMTMLYRLRADYGLSFLITGHDLEMIRSIADRVVVLDAGKVVEITTPAQLLETPQHPLTKQLVAAALPDVGIVPVF